MSIKKALPGLVSSSTRVLRDGGWLVASTNRELAKLVYTAKHLFALHYRRRALHHCFNVTAQLVQAKLVEAGTAWAQAARFRFLVPFETVFCPGFGHFGGEGTEGCKGRESSRGAWAFT